MPLLVNLQLLARESVTLKGELDVAELDLGAGNEVVRAVRPLQYDLEVEKLEDAVLARGTLALDLDCQCVRCLKPLSQRLVLKDWACHLPLQGEDAVAVSNDLVDLTPYLREDILLGFPQYPVCQPECGGMPGMSSGKLDQTSGAEPGIPSSAWTELDKLKL